MLFACVSSVFLLMPLKRSLKEARKDDEVTWPQMFHIEVLSSDSQEPPLSCISIIQ